MNDRRGRSVADAFPSAPLTDEEVLALADSLSSPEGQRALARKEVRLTRARIDAERRGKLRALRKRNVPPHSTLWRIG